jgi:hypothetical protein
MKKIFQPIVMSVTTAALFSVHPVHAQQIGKMKYDSNYIRSYPEKFGLRILASQNYASLNLPSAVDGHDLHYHTNPKLNLGIGGSYKNISLNLTLGVGYLNNKDIGKTKGLDFQFHFTPYKWEVDLLTSFHKGNYLSPKGYLSANPGKYYYRPDVKIDLIGVAVYRVANSERFSPGAALTQTVWQIKSAGSFLYGVEANYGLLKGDSSLFPANSVQDTNSKKINKIEFINAGVGIGYAYTLVIEKHYFISGSIIGNVDVTTTTEDALQGNKTKTNIGASAIYKGALGYNSGTWSISGNVSGNVLTANHVYSSKDYIYNSGIFRLSIAKKINLKHSKRK